MSEFQRFFTPTFTLETPRVLLRIMEPGDLEAYLSAGTSDDTWAYFIRQLNTEEAMKQWMDEALQEYRDQKRVPFTVIDKDTGSVCGSTSYGNISFFDRRIEIGWSWLGRDAMGTGVNKNAKFALLSFAFDVMGMKRVEIKTDNLNERAKAALLKVGMKPEGILRSHTQMHSNRRRDTIYFSIISEEWEERKFYFFPEML